MLIGSDRSTVTITTDTRDEGSTILNNSVSQVTVVTMHPPVIHPPIDYPPRVSVQTSPGEVVIVANETNKTQINESSSDYEFLDSLEVSAGELQYMKGQKLDESEVIIVNSSCVNDRDGRGKHFFFFFMDLVNFEGGC